MAEERVKDWAIRHGASERDAKLLEALTIAAHNGVSSDVAEILEEGPVGPHGHLALAAYFRGNLAPPKKRGRPSPPYNIRRAARLIDEAKQLFKKDGWKIKGGRTHEAAVAFAYSVLEKEGLESPDRERLENFIRRPKKLRTK